MSDNTFQRQSGLTLKALDNKLLFRLQPFFFLLGKQNFCKQQQPKGHSQFISPFNLFLCKLIPASSILAIPLIPPRTLLSPADCIFKNSFPGLHVPPASLSLSGKCPAPASVFRGRSSLSLSLYDCVPVQGIRSDVAVYR